MNTAIKFRAKSERVHIYLKNARYSAVTPRITKTVREEIRKKYSLPKTKKTIPLNYLVLGRIHSKVHMFHVSFS